MWRGGATKITVMKKAIALIGWTALLALAGCSTTAETTTTTTRERTSGPNASMDPSIDNTRTHSNDVMPATGPR